MRLWSFEARNHDLHSSLHRALSIECVQRHLLNEWMKNVWFAAVSPAPSTVLAHGKHSVNVCQMNEQMNGLCKSRFQQEFPSLVFLHLRSSTILASLWLLEWHIVIISKTQCQNLSQWGKVLDCRRERREGRECKRHKCQTYVSICLFAHSFVHPSIHPQQRKKCHQYLSMTHHWLQDASLFRC